MNFKVKGHLIRTGKLTALAYYYCHHFIWRLNFLGSNTLKGSVVSFNLYSLIITINKQHKALNNDQ